ncbi:hypothetical protein EYF80_054964 [Liparis tanakae]|uniref:Uncharacterized protein n=1 Tax=Liparis tanakae TaxID=230148 RepID=A0A4Z2F152_9TELE|nr:hypothetical protein EYF80_054964 [Liparis tanakae]
MPRSTRRVLMFMKRCRTAARERSGSSETHALFSGLDRIPSLNLQNSTFSSPDQFCSSTVGPTLPASAPGCLSLKSRGTRRTNSETFSWAHSQSRFVWSMAVSEDTRRHSSVQPASPRSASHFLETMNTDRP